VIVYYPLYNLKKSAYNRYKAINKEIVMKNTLKSQLAKSFSGNMELNKRALQMKNSFDEINGILGKGLKKKSNKKQS